GVFSVFLSQSGLGIKGIYLGYTSIHIQKNDMLGFGDVMGHLHPTGERRGGFFQLGAGGGQASKHTQKSQRAETTFTDAQHLPPAHRLMNRMFMFSHRSK